MDLFQCSISLLTLMISFSRITTSKGTPNVIDARAQSINRGVHNGLAFAKFKAHRFSYLNITSLGIDHVFNGKECGLACVNIPSCFSYNLAAFYDISGRALCELLPYDKYNNSDNFTSSQLFHHFSIVSPCMSGPCQNGGSCVSVCKENSYVCLCTKGYTGSICQTDIDDCASNPCKNYGTCSDRVNGFNCSCAPGFHGSLCEKEIDDCAIHPCKNNGTCTDRVNGFNCTCAPGFNGTQCETDIDDCASHPCKNNGICTDRVNGFNCSCAPGSKGPLCEAASTCKELYDENLGKENKAYTLKVGSMKIPVYCHMTSVGLGTCGGSGWTLVMKTDGTKNTFHFDSKLWSNKSEFNLPGGKTGLDSQETKLPTYWNTSFSKICLGMKIDHQIKFIVINVHAISLYSLIADGTYRATSLGRNTWETLIGSQASLQFKCNREGFNAACTDSRASRTRIGFVGNDQNACDSCDSRIGFGTTGSPDDTNTCGNTASAFADNGYRQIKTMCYILVQ